MTDVDSDAYTSERRATCDEDHNKRRPLVLPPMHPRGSDERRGPPLLLHGRIGASPDGWRVSLGVDDDIGPASSEPREASLLGAARQQRADRLRSVLLAAWGVVSRHARAIAWPRGCSADRQIAGDRRTMVWLHYFPGPVRSDAQIDIEAASACLSCRSPCPADRRWRGGR